MLWTLVVIVLSTIGYWCTDLFGRILICFEPVMLWCSTLWTDLIKFKSYKRTLLNQYLDIIVTLCISLIFYSGMSNDIRKLIVRWSIFLLRGCIYLGLEKNPIPFFIQYLSCMWPHKGHFKLTPWIRAWYSMRKSKKQLIFFTPVMQKALLLFK